MYELSYYIKFTDLEALYWYLIRTDNRFAVVAIFVTLHALFTCVYSYNKPMINCNTHVLDM